MQQPRLEDGMEHFIRYTYGGCLPASILIMRKQALITASATLHPLSLSQCSLRRTEGSRGDLD